MQTSHAIATALNVTETSHSYGDLMLLTKALQSRQVCISCLLFMPIAILFNTGAFIIFLFVHCTTIGKWLVSDKMTNFLFVIIR